MSVIEIPAAERTGKGVRVMGEKLRETQTSNLLTHTLTHTHRPLAHIHALTTLPQTASKNVTH